MDLLEYWNETCPPTNELVAAFVGFEPQNKRPQRTEFEQQYLAGVPLKKFNALPTFIQQSLRKK